MMNEERWDDVGTYHCCVDFSSEIGTSGPNAAILSSRFNETKLQGYRRIVDG